MDLDASFELNHGGPVSGGFRGRVHGEERLGDDDMGWLTEDFLDDVYECLEVEACEFHTVNVLATHFGDLAYVMSDDEFTEVALDCLEHNVCERELSAVLAEYGEYGEA